MRHVLITGTTGFIGVNLVRFFHQLGSVKVFGYSRNSMRAMNQLSNHPITWLEDLSVNTLDRHGIEVIIHLAGIAHDLSSSHSPTDYFEINYRKTAELFDAFARSRVNKFIFISSIKAVVENASGAIDETILPSPATPYGKSKLEAEKHIAAGQIAEGKRYYIFRPCMVHGRGNKGNLNLLFRFVKSGIPYPLGAFANHRSYLSIDNFTFVVNKFIENDFPSGTFNLADTGSLSTGDLVRIIAATMNKQARIISLPEGLVRFVARAGTALHLPFNASRLEKLTGEMVVSNEKILKTINTDLPVTLREGLSKTITSFL
jgi:nucleoside-diphosphate-sugar epimerase